MGGEPLEVYSDGSGIKGSIFRWKRYQGRNIQVAGQSR